MCSWEPSADVIDYELGFLTSQEQPQAPKPHPSLHQVPDSSANHVLGQQVLKQTDVSLTLEES